MTIPEERLLAYVDGLLSPEEIADIDRQLADNADAREILEKLKNSALPYAEAVETLIAVPDLTHIEAIIESHTKPQKSPFFRRYVPLAASIAVFFVVGLLAGQHIFTPTRPEPTKWAVWVDRIANYQALYSRTTLAMPTPPAKRRIRQMQRISKILGAELAAPDLTMLKADFKYARLYKIDGEPLAQIAYLPATGEPFSLCIMKTDKADHGPEYSKAHGLNVATWRRKGIAYVYVGETPKVMMDRYVGAMLTQLPS